MFQVAVDINCCSYSNIFNTFSDSPYQIMHIPSGFFLFKDLTVSTLNQSCSIEAASLGHTMIVFVVGLPTFSKS